MQTGEMSPLKPMEDNSSSFKDIKNYRVWKVVGKGAIGTVRLVLHKTRKEVYALKSVTYNTSVSKLRILIKRKF